MATRASKLNLTVAERRLVVLVGLIVFVLLNAWLVWPHAGDMARLRTRLEKARQTLKERQAVVARLPEVQAKIKEYEKSNPGSVESQSIELLRTIQAKAGLARVSITSYSPARTVTNEFFIEQHQTIDVQGREDRIIDFLYQVGQAEGLIRVRGLSLRPDPRRQYLTGRITLAASYPRVLSSSGQPAAPAQSARIAAPPQTQSTTRTNPAPATAASRPAATNRVTQPPAAPKPAASPATNPPAGTPASKLPKPIRQ